jgi:hypothetical protein
MSNKLYQAAVELYHVITDAICSDVENWKTEQSRCLDANLRILKESRENIVYFPSLVDADGRIEDLL